VLFLRPNVVSMDYQFFSHNRTSSGHHCPRLRLRINLGAKISDRHLNKQTQKNSETHKPRDAETDIWIDPHTHVNIKNFEIAIQEDKQTGAGKLTKAKDILREMLFPLIFILKIVV